MWREDKTIAAVESDAFTAVRARAERQAPSPPAIPDYLTEHYSWAYVTPEAVKRFERPWIIDAILWGNYARLSGAVRDRIDEPHAGRVLQIACAYGDFTPKLAAHVAQRSGRLDVVDVLPVQLANLRAKLGPETSVGIHRMDSAAMTYEDSAFDSVVLFLLLHEMPDAWRRGTLAEAWRVLKPGGRLVLVDYAKPAWWNPLRYLMAPVLALLEPFALALWRRPISDFAPAGMFQGPVERRTACGGLYQLLTIEKR